MNRRHLLVAALSAPILALPLPALASARQITWAPGAMESPHALLVARSLAEVIREGVLYTVSDWAGMGYAIKLVDPTFKVEVTDIIWHPTRGYRYEPSLNVEVYERGIWIGTSSLYSLGDYTDYYGKPATDREPYGLRRVHVPYERYADEPRQIHNERWEMVEERPRRPYATIPELTDALGRNAIDLDMRWLREYEKAA